MKYRKLRGGILFPFQRVDEEKQKKRKTKTDLITCVVWERERETLGSGSSRDKKRGRDGNVWKSETWIDFPWYLLLSFLVQKPGLFQVQNQNPRLVLFAAFPLYADLFRRNGFFSAVQSRRAYRDTICSQLPLLLLVFLPSFYLSLSNKEEKEGEGVTRFPWQVKSSSDQRLDALELIQFVSLTCFSPSPLFTRRKEVMGMKWRRR